MYKFRFVLVFLLFPVFFYAQIGIGTPIPNVNASLHLAEENKTLILNHVSDKSEITNPYDGMIFYDVTEKCFRGYANGEFTDCFGVKTEAVPPVVSAEGPGFVGEYISGQSLSNSSFMVTVSNNSFSLAQIGFAITDLNITDSNIEVSAVKYLNESNSLTDLPNGGLSFASGASYKIVYILTGTPVQPGSITGNWNKLSLNYSDSINVEYKLNCDSGTLVNIQPNLSQGLRSGVAYNGEYKITFSGANGFVFPAESYTVSGLTLSRTSVSGLDSGELIYNITGTYSGEDKGSIVFNTLYGCEIHLDLPSSCNEILRLDPSLLNQDGVYKIDVDGPGGLAPMDCYCDMTTDKGGWTLVLNYNHKGGTNPGVKVRTNDLPLLGSVALGIDESETEYWGHFSNSLANQMEFKEVRFYGISNSMTSTIVKPARTALGNDGGVMNFVTNHSNVINYIKTGIGSMSGIQNLITATNEYGYRMLNGHTTNLPYVVDSFMSNKGDYSLTFFPFFKESTITWGIGSYFNGYYRWEVDEWTNSYEYNTIHQVWVK